MLIYQSATDLSSRTLQFLTGMLKARRQEIGTRWRRLPASRQALPALANLRCGDTYAQLAARFGVGIATVYRYLREAVEALAALAPSLAEAMRTIREKAFVILDGTLLPIDRITADTPYYSGKHKRHGMNMQVLADPMGQLLWASPALPRLDSRPDRRAAARDHRSHYRSRTQMLSGQGVPRRGRTRPGPVSRPASQAVAASPQQHPRQDALPRQAGHGHSEELASPAEASLQHHPHHSNRPGRPRRSPRASARLEKAQSVYLEAPSATTTPHVRAHDGRHLLESA